MTTWTPAAMDELTRHLDRVRGRLSAANGDGGTTAMVDAAEVVEDLRRHVDEEFSKEGVSVVTAADVRRVLTRIGMVDDGFAFEAARADRSTSPAVGAGLCPPAEAVRPEPAREVVHEFEDPARQLRRRLTRPEPGFVRSTAAFIFGVLTPALAVGIELSQGLMATELFDPLPTGWHVALASTLPLSNLLMLLLSDEAVAAHRRKLGALNAFAIGVGAFYSLIFLPMVPLSMIAIVFFGLGFLSLSPITGLAVAWRSRRRFADVEVETGRAVPRPRLRLGLSLAGLAVAVLYAGPVVTHVGLASAASRDEAVAARGLWMLRHFGQDDSMLRACYARRGTMGDPVRALISAFDEVSPERAREIYYRATGTPFNAYPPPRGTFRERGRTWEWDFDTGGDAVAGQVKGLSLSESRIDGIVDGDGLSAYDEWTMVFKNDAGVAREARAQVLLPGGAVVSRLTLWVNGQPCEAAFSGRERVKTAYKQVAVVQRRDPVLVTTAGPDRVLVQCFPVPAHGTMKIRLGITAPMRPGPRADRAMAGLPVIVERNFAIKESLRHAVWLEGTDALSDPAGLLRAERPKEKLFALRGELTDGQLGTFPPTVTSARDPKVTTTWATPPAQVKEEAGVVVQRIASATTRPSSSGSPGHVVVVVDTSRTMGEAVKHVADALASIPAGVKVDVMLAGDEPTVLTQAPMTDAAAMKPVADRLREATCVGGSDAAPALCKAWDAAADVADGVVLWVYGPQPAALTSVEGLRQRYERRPDGPRILAIAGAAGPNRVCEAFDEFPRTGVVAREGGLGDDLRRLFFRWGGGAGEVAVTRELATTRPSGDGVKQTSPHLARLWAFEKVRELGRSRSHAAEALRLAMAYQLVTSVSGAVVLETAAQYAANGLQPVDPATVPTVPEPETVALIGVAVAAVGWTVWRRRRAGLARAA